MYIDYENWFDENIDNISKKYDEHLETCSAIKQSPFRFSQFAYSLFESENDYSKIIHINENNYTYSYAN